MKVKVVFLLPVFWLLYVNICNGQQPAVNNSLPSDEDKEMICADRVVENNLPIPDFKIVNTLEGAMIVAAKIRWNVDENLKKKYGVAFNSLEKAISKKGQKSALPFSVRIKILSHKDIAALHPNLPVVFKEKNEAYLIQLRDQQANIYATDTAGIINAISSLEYLIVKNNGKLPKANIADWPDIEVRSMQLALRGITARVAKAAIDRMRRGHYNLLGIDIGNNVRFKSLGKLATNCAWSIEEFLDVVKYARESGMEVVPGLRFLTHQNKDFLVPGAYPELMYNYKTYDPRKKEVYDLVFPYIDEVIALIRPEAINIGHDEVYGVNDKHKGKVDALPAPLFKLSILKLHAYLKSKNVKTWIAGDMLLTPSEFTGMHPGSLNGTPEYAAIRKDLPKDIMICDWHYRNEGLAGDNPQFQSMKAFIDEGFDVMGVTFKDKAMTKAFAKYAYELKSPKVIGMSGSTWSFIIKGANSKNSDNWATFDEVLRDSAEAFWNVTN